MTYQPVCSSGKGNLASWVVHFGPEPGVSQSPLRLWKLCTSSLPLIRLTVAVGLYASVSFPLIQGQ